MRNHIRRREFITLLGTSAAAWPLAARGQQPDRVRRIGILASDGADAITQTGLIAFTQELERLGWSEGRNLHIDTRSAAGQAERFQPLAKELVALRPDAIVAQTTSVAQALQRETHTIPIVFIWVGNPIDAGLIASLAHPGGNLTGLLQFEEGIAGKWLAMLKEFAPHLRRVAIVGNRELTAFDYYLRSALAAASSVALELVPTHVANAADIERTFAAFARMPDGGLMLTPSTTLLQNREPIIRLAAEYRLPAIYSDPSYVDAGGLISYGPSLFDQWPKSTYFIDRILRGTKPTELPVQTPTKYETILNLKTARELGLPVPPVLLVAADRVIE